MKFRHSATTLTTRWGLAAVFLALAATAEALEPPSIDLPAVKKTSGPAVGLVTVQNSMGLPVAYATGFLLGEGRFLITDLSALARPDAVQATIEFDDGTVYASKKFGLANPAIGLAVIQLEASTLRPGLDLSSAAPGASPVPVALLGWQWGQTLTGAAGRLGTGPATIDLAARLGVDPPAEKWELLIFNGGRVGGANGSPVIERSGAVLGINLTLLGKGGLVSTVIPAAVVRQALLSAKPELKPFSQLPKPLWPALCVRAVGEPLDTGDLGRLVAETKAALLCKTCSGQGWVMTPTKTRKTCATCNGEKFICNETAYDACAQMGAQGARVSLNPDKDVQGRKAATAAAMEVLQTAHKADKTFRPILLRLSAKNFAKPGFPHGFVTYVQVRDAMKAPDGEYFLLATHPAGYTLVTRAEALQDAGAKRPAPGDWMLLSGLAAGCFDLSAASAGPGPAKAPEPGVEKWQPPPDMQKEEAAPSGKLNAPANGKGPNGNEKAAPLVSGKVPPAPDGKGVLFIHPFLWLSCTDLTKPAAE
jgi:hypothetical protein